MGNKTMIIAGWVKRLDYPGASFRSFDEGIELINMRGIKETLA
jgi:hypothetical protein